jgi:hypothetical protein
MRQFLIILASLFVLSCTKDFEEININPNQPEKVPAKMIFTQLVFQLSEFSASHAYHEGNFITQHTAKQNFTDFDRYAWGPASGPWNNLFARLRDVENLIILAQESGNTNYEGIGLIWRAWAFAYLTDLYGDIPYSEAIKGKSGGNYSPAYDKQQDIYQGILADLRRANELLDQKGSPIGDDILYNNNIMKWKKFANSLRMRYLLRISNVENVSSEMAQILDNPQTFPVFESNEDQAALTYLASAPNQWFSHTDRIGSFRERRMSQTIEDRFDDLNDPRIREYFRPTAAFINGEWEKEFNGFPNGLGEAEAMDWDGGSAFQSELAEKYYNEPNSAQAIVMTYFELQFIKAEAAFKGLISGNHQTYYINGVRSALKYYNVKDEKIDEYLEQTNVQLNGTNDLERIMLQKWIGNFMVGIEGWNDWRRTGLPEFMPAVSDDNNNMVPVRYLYPQDEQVYNTENRNAAIQRQGPDDINTRIWWMGEK